MQEIDQPIVTSTFKHEEPRPKLRRTSEPVISEVQEERVNDRKETDRKDAERRDEDRRRHQSFKQQIQ